MQFTVKPIWKDQTCVILAGGPSLRGFNFDEEIGGNCKNFITINDSWRLLPSGTKAINYFCDHAWWSMQLQKNLRSLDGHTSFHDMIYRGFWVTISHDPGFIDHPQIHVLTNTGQRGLELDPSGLRHGSNAGYQAINLAVHLGAKRIVLLGYDMKVDGNRTNWHNIIHSIANFRHNSGRCRRHFTVNFISSNIQYGFIHFYDVTRLFVPLQNGSFSNTFTHFGHYKINNRHIITCSFL